ncbi:predicted protein [Plenodomus lingam JN3]|uniref:Predicted protein n=1 Tax=Leptosphaeria maculans (strain JN3 / isolate v23.1.3 / race Av1-4-5-6-7-8) TaxID=985895 RepID=E4ZJ86_LEPMJ|nr:predicted protein [Plenodomus lingam JN3]CBX91517.1 predicted protein [Plenodomus lingam JN3]
MRPMPSLSAAVLHVKRLRDFGTSVQDGISPLDGLSNRHSTPNMRFDSCMSMFRQMAIL